MSVIVLSVVLRHNLSVFVDLTILYMLVLYSYFCALCQANYECSYYPNFSLYYSQ